MLATKDNVKMWMSQDRVHWLFVVSKAQFSCFLARRTLVSD
jgi:hypothetical protein